LRLLEPGVHAGVRHSAWMTRAWTCGARSRAAGARGGSHSAGPAPQLRRAVRT